MQMSCHAMWLGGSQKGKLCSLPVAINYQPMMPPEEISRKKEEKKQNKEKTQRKMEKKKPERNCQTKPGRG